MGHFQRTAVRQHAATATRRGHGFARTAIATLLLALSYVALTGAAFGPPAGALGDLGRLVLPASPPSIRYEGTDAIITGSIGELFRSAIFSGPNRAEKTDRHRRQIDTVKFVEGFAAARLHLASLRLGALPGLPQMADQGALADPEREQGPRLSVAVIDPSNSGALTAIDAFAPHVDAPTPFMASQQLAYARAIAPVTGDYAAGPATAVSEKDLWCLATAIYFEARGESYRGQVAVAQVVMNRIKHRLYPKTICGVVFQNQNSRNGCQFSFACDGIPETVTDGKAWKQAQEIAQGVTDGVLYLPEVADATHYHATYVSPVWAPRMHKIAQVGLHVFYRFKSGWLFG